MQTDTLLHKIRERLMQGGFITAPVMTDSMVPALLPGERCHVAYQPLTSLAPGMILAYERAGAMVWHRFLGFRDDALIMKGDRSLEEDLPVQPFAYLGVVTPLYKKRAPSRLHDVLSKTKLILRAGISELLVAGQEISLLQTLWSNYLIMVRSIVERSLGSMPQVRMLHSHARYKSKKIIPGSSDVDLTVILKAEMNPPIRQHAYTVVMHRALRLARCLPCFDPPYLFFEDELDDIKHTSTFFAQSLGDTPRMIVEPDAYRRAIGLLDELYALCRRYVRLSSTSPALTFIRGKRDTELAKIYADLCQLAAVCYDPQAFQGPLPISRAIQALTGDALQAAVHTKLFELGTKIFELPEIQKPIPEGTPLAAYPEHCLAAYRQIPVLKRPVTLHMGQFLRGLQ
jgi:hypothetical protein